MEDFSSWTIPYLKELLLQYGIDTRYMKGSGKNGNMIKKDYIKLSKKYVKYQDVNPKYVTQLPNEMWEEILLQSDENLCLLNKQTVSICQSKEFWYKKFASQDLPIDWVEKDLTLSDLVKHYHKLLFAKNYSHRLIELFKHLHQLYPNEYFSIFSYSQEIGNYTKVFPNHIKQLNRLEAVKERHEDSQYVSFIMLFADNENLVQFDLQDDQGDDVLGINNTIDDAYRTLDEVEEILMRWLYFVDDDDLVDESGFSFFYDNLNESMNKLFKPNQYNQRQYKMLKARLDFLQ